MLGFFFLKVIINIILTGFKSLKNAVNIDLSKIFCKPKSLLKNLRLNKFSLRLFLRRSLTLVFLLVEKLIESSD